MKTIISIIEVILYNLFPAALAAPVIILLKDILPLIGVAVIRAGLYIMVSFQKLQHDIFHRTENEEMLELNNASSVK